MSWSSGKDSAWALHRLRAEGVDVVGLMTTVNTTHDRVAMHAVRRGLLQAQAAAVGLPLIEVPLPWPCPNEAYEAAMADALARAVSDGVEAIGFGDLFLEDIRRYREAQLAPMGLHPLFPLWGEPTPALARTLVAAGVRAVITAVDPRQAPASLAGRAWEDVQGSLPPGVDPCGENGEFHTFVWDGPMLARPVPVQVGEVVTRDGFVFADVLPA
jgi:uncharacterized protein (TIGR00290 family)